MLFFLQFVAVEFIWDNIIESVDRLKENADGSGCILAHCMGLGKTLSVSNYRNSTFN